MKYKIKKYLKNGQHLWYSYPCPLSRRELQLLRTGPRVLANTVPKSGTNLLGHVLALMPPIVSRWRYHISMTAWGARDQVFRIRPGQVATAHWKWEEQSQALIRSSTCVFLMVRDPRDVVVSNAFYITNQNPNHRLHNYFSSLKSDEERILASIQGIPSDELGGMRRSKSMGEHLRGFLPWIDQDECMLIRFEDLIGERGGGDEERQRQCIRRIAKHIGYTLNQRELKSIADRAFSTDSKTFRKGRTGDWRNHFTDRHVQATKKTMGEVLVRLGYEEDEQWEV